MIIQILLALWMLAVTAAAFLWVKPAEAFQVPEAARILFFHVPCAMVATVAFLVATIYGIRFLKDRQPMDDAKSAISSGLGLVFTILATVSGAVFAKIEWGSAWNWDPRETSIFILLLIYAAYFALRSSVEGDERRGTLSAVYSIIAFLTVPFLVFIMPRMMSSLHPNQTLSNRSNLDMQYRIVLYAAMLGFMGIYAMLFRMRAKLAARKLGKSQKIKELTK
jgi:heme exporter protein C